VRSHEGPAPATGADLARLRRRLGLTQAEAARLCCASGQVTWSRWEALPRLRGWPLLAYRALVARERGLRTAPGEAFATAKAS